MFNQVVGVNDGMRIGRTKRRTTEDLPTTASPARQSGSIKGMKGSNELLSKNEELNFNGLVGRTGSSVSHRDNCNSQLQFWP